MVLALTLTLVLVLTLALAPSGMISKKGVPEFCPSTILLHFSLRIVHGESIKAGLWTILLQETAPDNSSTEAVVNK